MPVVIVFCAAVEKFRLLVGTFRLMVENISPVGSRKIAHNTQIEQNNGRRHDLPAVAPKGNS